MRILTSDTFTTMPWKNGGGVTHEIARAEEAGRLIWRLSVAEVAADGPFSAFLGLMRVLTVLSGAGLVLRTPEGVIEAAPLRPVRFPGDLPVTAERVAGAVRDFNVIFDPARVAAQVSVLCGPIEIEGRTPGHRLALLALGGRISAGNTAVPAGALALDATSICLAEGARGLLVRFSPPRGEA
jgi:hypothetical protein